MTIAQLRTINKKIQHLTQTIIYESRTLENFSARRLDAVRCDVGSISIDALLGRRHDYAAASRPVDGTTMGRRAYGQQALHELQCRFLTQQISLRTAAPKNAGDKATRAKILRVHIFFICQVNFCQTLGDDIFSHLPYRFGSWQTTTNGKQKIPNCWRCS